ncbi:MAG: glycosyltransferase family 9 protein [Bacteroidetes bacterium]|nr:glycosyltransferase family 9 protein [Bacteroidota bacterium]
MKFPSREQWLYFFNILVSRWVNSGKNISAYYPENILCIKWDEIGDLATSTHVFSLLHSKFPDAKIDVITKPYSATLLLGNPNINQVFTDISAWNKKYDFVIEMRGTSKSLWKIFRYFPKVRLDRGTVRARHRGMQLHEYDTNYEIIKPIIGNLENRHPEIFITQNALKRIEEFINHNGLVRYAVIHAGARRELRRWTDSGYAEICNWLYAVKGLQLVFAGTVDEENQIQKITEKLNVPFTLFTNHFDLMELSALLQKATLFVGNESGPLQIACALKTPLVALFGPGVPTVFYPKTSNSAMIHHVLECNPCDQIHCVHPENTCMQRITVLEVKTAIESVLTNANS